jgi:hypothetical protein
MGGAYTFGTLQATTARDLTIAASGAVQKLSAKCVGIWVGGTGDLVVSLIGEPDNYVTFTAVPAGTFVQGRFANIENIDGGCTVTFATSLHVGGNWRG